MEKRPEKFFMSKIAALCSIVELSKVLSIENNVSLSTKLVRRIEKIVQESPVVS